MPPKTSETIKDRLRPKSGDRGARSTAPSPESNPSKTGKKGHVPGDSEGEKIEDPRKEKPDLRMQPKRQDRPYSVASKSLPNDDEYEEDDEGGVSLTVDDALNVSRAKSKVTKGKAAEEKSEEMKATVEKASQGKVTRGRAAKEEANKLTSKKNEIPAFSETHTISWHDLIPLFAELHRLSIPKGNSEADEVVEQIRSVANALKTQENSNQ